MLLSQHFTQHKVAQNKERKEKIIIMKSNNIYISEQTTIHNNNRTLKMICKNIKKKNNIKDHKRQFLKFLRVNKIQQTLPFVAKLEMMKMCSFAEDEYKSGK
jgi:hypothetical protein